MASASWRGLPNFNVMVASEFPSRTAILRIAVRGHIGDGLTVDGALRRAAVEPTGPRNLDHQVDLFNFKRSKDGDFAIAVRSVTTGASSPSLLGLIAHMEPPGTG